MRTCSTCKIQKSYECFHRDRTSHGGYSYVCKPCKLKAMKSFAENNPEVIKERRARAYKKTMETDPDYYNRWARNNPESRKKTYEKAKPKRREYHNNWQKEKKASDPNYRMMYNLRVSITRILRRGTKQSKTIDYIGMPIDAFLIYLNLDCIDKYGEPYTGNEKKYHVDHIKPLASFPKDCEESIKQAFHWTNFQILTAKENQRKSDKLPEGVK